MIEQLLFDVSEALLVPGLALTVAAPAIEEPLVRMDRGAALELDDMPATPRPRGLDDDVAPLDRELELD